jgi:hypothetical protein
MQVNALASETPSITLSMPTTATAAYFVLRDRKAVARRATIVFVVFMIQFLSGSMENRRAASISRCHDGRSVFGV